MINQNARRTGAAGFMARALGTLGAATLLLTSTGWGALAADTGFGAVNLKAYQGAAAAVPAWPDGASRNTGRPPGAHAPLRTNEVTSLSYFTQRERRVYQQQDANFDYV